MSHFAVAVITKEKPDFVDNGFWGDESTMINDILAPYDENIIVDEYIAQTKAELIQDGIDEFKRCEEYIEEAEKGKIDVDPDRIKKMKRELKKFHDAEDSDQRNDIAYKHAIRYFDPENLDEDGNRLSTYNPKSKWDWYQVGGRFGDMFEKNPIQLKDFPKPVDMTEEEMRKKYPDIAKEWDKIQAGTYTGFYRVEYLQKRYPTLRAYVKSHVDRVPWAVVDEDGNWHEPGTMGWFAISDASMEEEINWTESFYDTFIRSKDGEWYMTIVDCHI